MWELRRGGRITAELAEETEVSRRTAAKIETVEMITEVMLGVLRTSGYVPPRGQVLAEEKLRRMLRRFELNAADAEVFLGMMRKIAWKVGD